MDKKSPLIQELEEYFKNTPREQLEKTLNELEPYNEYGPTINEHPILKNLMSIYQMLLKNNFSKIGRNSNNIKRLVVQH